MNFDELEIAPKAVWASKGRQEIIERNGFTWVARWSKAKDPKWWDLDEDLRLVHLTVTGRSRLVIPGSWNFYLPEAFGPCMDIAGGKKGFLVARLP